MAFRYTSEVSWKYARRTPSCGHKPLCSIGADIDLYIIYGKIQYRLVARHVVGTKPRQGEYIHPMICSTVASLPGQTQVSSLVMDDTAVH